MVFRLSIIVSLACKGNPILATLLVFLYYMAFSMIEAMIERLLFGERFEHWIDPFFALTFMMFAGLCSYQCAKYKETP